MTAPARIEPQLEFFPEDHRYELDGRPIPSVTTVLMWGVDHSRIPEWTAHRGTALHLATEFYDENDLDPESVDPCVKPHLDAYAEWHRKHNPTYIATEEKVWGEIGGLIYCGTIDRVMLHPRGHHIITDIKSGAPRSDHGAQVQAYRHAYMQRTGVKDVGCAGLYCGKDANWQWKDYNQPHHFESFRVKLRKWYEANTVQTPQTTEA